MKLHLEREYWPAGTNGTIKIDDYRICHTIEKPWGRNTPNSCIPEGIYTLERAYDEQFGWHMKVSGVSGRPDISIVPGSSFETIPAGNILPVSRHVGEGKGSQCRLAFEKLKELIYAIMDQDEQVLLEIRSYPDAALNLVQYELSWMD